MIVARKGGKLPGSLITKEYELEYGKDRLSIQNNAIEPFNSFAIVDDLIATGGTVNSASQIIWSRGKEVTGVVVVVELAKNIRKGDFKYPIHSLVNFD